MRASGDTRWEQPWGEHRLAMNVGFRLYYDGTGFRYEPSERLGLATAKIIDGITEFGIVPQSTAWWIAGGE